MFQDGDKFKVTLSGDSFKGFMLQAHNDKKKPIGSFEPGDGGDMKTTECKGKDDTLTHENPKEKKEITATWKPPKGFKGEPKFKASVVKKFNKFYVGITG